MHIHAQISERSHTHTCIYMYSYTLPYIYIHAHLYMHKHICKYAKVHTYLGVMLNGDHTRVRSYALMRRAKLFDSVKWSEDLTATFDCIKVLTD